MSNALKGEHYCEAHQGNHSYYAKENCTVCALQQRIAELEAENKELRNECARGVHSCWAECPRPMCVLRRERDALEAESQRLRQALKEAVYFLGIADKDDEDLVPGTRRIKAALEGLE